VSGASAPDAPPGRRVRVYAHRGAAIESPENTLVSFRKALEHGADALEMDAHLTSDGHVVIAHDEDGVRTCNVACKISGATLREVQGWDAGWGFTGEGGARPFAKAGHRVPTLHQVLAEFPGVPINVDLKAESDELVDAFLKVVRGRREEERVIAASFHRANLKRLRRQFYAGTTALAQSEVIELLTLPAFVWRRLPHTGSAAQLPTRAGPLKLTSARVVARCRAAGVRLDFWTVNDPAEATALVALDVDGIMTDDPARIVPAVRATGR
jgi:glycerophosphoryl diester phosphodiesterase